MKPAFENILGEAEREKYPNLVAWYGTVSSDGKLKKHLKTQMTKERKQYDAKEVAGKLAKEEEKARKKAEKEAKFAAKKAAQEAAKAQKGAKPAKDAKPKVEKKKEKEITEYTEKTPMGEKKSTT